MAYTVNGLDTSADGMEPVRMQSEVILLASANAGHKTKDLREQWHEDIESCDRGDWFDYEAAHKAVDEFCDANTAKIDRECERLENPDYADEDGYATFRLYVETGGDPSET